MEARKLASVLGLFARLASTGKELRFGNDARASILKGVETLAKAVGTTLGPKGRTVLIDDDFEPRITKDGVTVARAVDFKDRYMNVGANLVKNVAVKTNEEAGDGTTTATILAHSIFREGVKSVAAGMNPADLKRGIDMAVEAVVRDLKKKAKHVGTKEELKQVATVSANGDASIGEFISSAMERVGKEGIITVEESKTLKDELIVVDGVKFDQGFTSPFFVTDAHAMKVELEDPLILLCNKRLTTVQDVAGPMNYALGKMHRPLLIIAEDIEGDALAVLIFNKIRNGAKVCAIKAPGYGESRRAWLQDLAVMGGGQMIAEEAGIRLDNPDPALFATARKVIVTKDATIVQGGGGRPPAIKAHCDGLKEQAKNTDLSEYDRDRIKQRIAKLTGGVAVLKVGGGSELEVSEKKDRVTDALNATKAAVEEGVLPGGGVALLHASKILPALKAKVESLDQRVGVQIIADSLKQPTRQICDNAGVEGVLVVGRLMEEKDPNVGFDASTGRYVQMIKSGIVDPLKVVRTALVDAASVASVMTTSEAVIVEEPKDDKAEKPATPASLPKF